jgi:Protein of unknown function (DUF1254)
VDTKSSQFKAPFNEINNQHHVATYEDTAIVTPNSDTPYSPLWLNLRAQRMVLSVPAVAKEHSYSVQLIDGNTYNYGYIAAPWGAIRATTSSSGQIGKARLRCAFLDSAELHAGNGKGPHRRARPIVPGWNVVDAARPHADVAKMSQLNSDSLRVQVLRWFAINVDARSGEEALVVAENLPRAFEARGRRLTCETLASRSGVG